MEPIDESVALLARMAAKPGVQATLILSRTDGAILRADNVDALRKKRNPNTTSSSSTIGSSLAAKAGAGGEMNGQAGIADGTADDGESKEKNAARTSSEEVARIVWRMVKATEGAVLELDDEDEVRLLRVRTKRNELVIVPSSKFLLVVVHDTPPA